MPRKKSLRAFVREHREEIDRAVREMPGRPKMAPELNDSDREEWVLNERGLYDWARRENVNV